MQLSLCRVLIVVVLLLVQVTLLYADGEKVNLRVGYVPIISQLPVIVADTNTRLSYEKISVSLSKFNTFTSMEAGIRVGAIDAAFIPVPIALSMAADGVDIDILGSMSQGGSVLLSKLPGDYRILRGKVVAVPGLDSNENIRLKEVLDHEGLRYGLDYKVISVPFKSVLKDLDSGRIDALYFPEPYGTMALNKGLAVTVINQDSDLSSGLMTVLVIKKTFLEPQYKKSILEWLESLVTACGTLKHFAESDDIERISSFDFDKQIVEFSLKEKMGGIRFSPEPPDIDQIRQYLEKVIQLKILYKSIAIESIVYPDLFESLLVEASAK